MCCVGLYQDKAVLRPSKTGSVRPSDQTCGITFGLQLARAHAFGYQDVRHGARNGPIALERTQKVTPMHLLLQNLYGTGLAPHHRRGRIFIRCVFDAKRRKYLIALAGRRFFRLYRCLHRQPHRHHRIRRTCRLRGRSDRLRRRRRHHHQNRRRRRPQGRLPRNAARPARVTAAPGSVRGGPLARTPNTITSSSTRRTTRSP